MSTNASKNALFSCRSFSNACCDGTSLDLRCFFALTTIVLGQIVVTDVVAMIVLRLAVVAVVLTLFGTLSPWNHNHRRRRFRKGTRTQTEKLNGGEGSAFVYVIRRMMRLVSLSTTSIQYRVRLPILATISISVSMGVLKPIY